MSKRMRGQSTASAVTVLAFDADSSAAPEDLQSICHRIAFVLSAPQAARNQAERIQRAAESLKYSPLRHQPVPWEPWRSMGCVKHP